MRYFLPSVLQSFVTATPKSGHVVRRQARTEQQGPRKRGVGTESSEPEEPAEKRGNDAPMAVSPIRGTR